MRLFEHMEKLEKKHYRLPTRCLFQNEDSTETSEIFLHVFKCTKVVFFTALTRWNEDFTHRRAELAG